MSTSFDEIRQRSRDIFRQEAADLLVELEGALLDLEKEPTDRSHVDRVFRALHTLKGSGATSGFPDLSAYLHHVEDVFNAAREGRLGVCRELVDQTLAIADAVNRYLAAPAHQAGAILAAAQDPLARLSALLPSAPASHASPDSDPLPETKGSAEQRLGRFRIRFRPHVTLFQRGADPGMFLDDLRALGACDIRVLTQRLPAFGELDPELCYLDWEIELQTSATPNDVRDVFLFIEDACDLEIVPVTEDEIGPARNGAPNLAPAADAPVSGRPAEPAAEIADVRPSTAVHDILKVSADKVDRLVNLVGELVILRSQVSAACSLLEHVPPALSGAAQELDRLSAELREVVLNVRMMPVGETFNKFRRLVRDMSRELGKTVELVVEGESTEMDKSMLDQLYDPLLHLVRNSLDHGLEKPDQRQGKGKPAAGVLRMSAEQRGDRVCITVADDGRGLDAEAIRQKALAKGLLTAEQNPSEAELFQMIFLAGFSTAATVSHVSGRGVGMDVVRKRIEAMRGTIELHSQPGRGTEIRLSLPLTLAIVEGLMVGIGDERYIIPCSLVREIIERPRAVDGTRNLIELRGQPVSVLSLRKLLGVSGSPREVERIVVVELDGVSLGLAVDDVLGNHQTVLKSLGWLGRRLKLFSGATIVGNGRVALILDISEIVAASAEREFIKPSIS